MQQILSEYAARSDFVRVMHHDNRGFRSVGPGVIRAFYAGIDAISAEEWEWFNYICKFELDLDLPSIYLEEMIRSMNAEPWIGTRGGKPFHATAGWLRGLWRRNLGRYG